MVYKFFKKIVFAFMCFYTFVICFISCKKNETKLAEVVESPKIIEVQEEKNVAHTWYAFNSSGFEKVRTISEVPRIHEKPWTESIRIAGASSTFDELNNKIPIAYALVNRLGMLVFKDKSIQLKTDISIFSENTVTDLFFENNVPLFSIYKSSFFNDSAIIQKTNENSNELRPFLLEYNNNSGVFFPLINYEDLNLDFNTQITDFFCDAKNILCSVKKSTTQKNDFSYLNIELAKPLTSINSQTANESFYVQESNATEFRNMKSPKDFSKAPNKLKKLLENIPQNIHFSVETSFSGRGFSITFEKKSQNEDDNLLDAKAVIDDSWALAIFSDGTSYFAGNLYNRKMLFNGNTVAFKLPKLPENFNYSYFAISGTHLYVAWEESSFYKTSRSGFIKINLDDVLYNSNGE